METETTIVTRQIVDSDHVGPRHHRRWRGQSLVELVFVSTIMIFILVITVDFARAYSAYIEVSNSARAGAIYGSRSIINYNDDAGMQNAALLDSPTIYGTAPTVTPARGTDSDGLLQVAVTVDYTFTPIFASFPGIPASVDLSRTVQMRVLG